MNSSEENAEISTFRSAAPCSISRRCGSDAKCPETARTGFQRGARDDHPRGRRHPEYTDRHSVRDASGPTDEVVIVNTHTDGPNSTEENGGIGVWRWRSTFRSCLAPETPHDGIRSRDRPLRRRSASADGVMQKHPELIRKTAVALTVEHLGAMEWKDDASLNYRATGKPVLSYAITPHRRRRQ